MKTFSWWRHQMETFSALMAICAGNSPVPVTSLHKSQWRGALMLALICVWVNNHDAGDLRRYRFHYDVIVMFRETTRKRCFFCWSAENTKYANADYAVCTWLYSGWMITLSNWSIFRVTGPLWGKSTGHRWIPLTKGSDVELWYLLWSAPEQTVE